MLGARRRAKVAVFRAVSRLTLAARCQIVADMTREQLARRIAEVALLRGEFTLRSGRKSNYYLDKYRFETQPDGCSSA